MTQPKDSLPALRHDALSGDIHETHGAANQQPASRWSGMFALDWLPYFTFREDGKMVVHEGPISHIHEEDGSFTVVDDMRFPEGHVIADPKAYNCHQCGHPHAFPHQSPWCSQECREKAISESQSGANSLMAESRPIAGFTFLAWWPMSRPTLTRIGSSWLLQFGPFGLRRLPKKGGS